MKKEALKKRVPGKSGIEVTEIGMGMWAAGGDQWGATEDREILQAIDAALEEGVNFFDTADVYGAGHSEELLGQAMQGRRDRFIVATKIGWIGFDGEAGQSAYTSVEKVMAGVEDNLRRLQTDYIDLIQSHINFREPTMEIILEGFQRLQREGKVRAYGVSTSDLEYLQAFNADGNCASLQIDYSILHRMPENDVLPYCLKENIGVIVRGALAMGILTGKYSKESRFGEGDFRRNWHEEPEQWKTYLDDLQKVDQLRPLAGDRTMAQLALQFTLANPAVTAVIPGAKSLRQINDNVQAGLLPPLQKSDMDRINTVVPPGGGRKIWPA